MKFDFYKTNSPTAPAPIALRTVYVLQADASYDVRKKDLANPDYVALRTYDGMGRIHIEGVDEITLLPGTLLFFEHRLVRRYYCMGNKWNFWWFEFAAEEVVFPLNTLLQIDIFASEMEHCNTCLELLRKDSIHANSTASALLNFLICQWLMRHNKKTAPDHSLSSVEQVIEHMKTRLPHTLSLKEMSAMTGLSERRFRDLFKKATGYPPKKYYDLLRVKIAEGYLANTNYAINEISDMLGYSSQFHFSKAFKKIHGVPPSKFRQI